MVSVLTDVCSTVAQLTSGILRCKEGMDPIYENKFILASLEVNTFISLPLSLGQFWM